MDKSCQNQDHSKCPIREMLTRLGDKWSILIIYTLSQAPAQRLRFSALLRGIQGISQRMLTTTLRNLERDGAVKRHFYPEVPPRVEYELTPLGKSLLNPVQALMVWVEANWGEISAARATFDAATAKKKDKAA
jgi:DNA-binding HxlR family transcriptional regulator